MRGLKATLRVAKGSIPVLVAPYHWLKTRIDTGLAEYRGFHGYGNSHGYGYEIGMGNVIRPHMGIYGDF